MLYVAGSNVASRLTRPKDCSWRSGAAWTLDYQGQTSEALSMTSICEFSSCSCRVLFQLPPRSRYFGYNSRLFVHGSQYITIIFVCMNFSSPLSNAFDLRLVDFFHSSSWVLLGSEFAIVVCLCIIPSRLACIYVPINQMSTWFSIGTETSPYCRWLRSPGSSATCLRWEHRGAPYPSK